MQYTRHIIPALPFTNHCIVYCNWSMKSMLKRIVLYKDRDQCQFSWCKVHDFIFNHYYCILNVLWKDMVQQSHGNTFKTALYFWVTSTSKTTPCSEPAWLVTGQFTIFSVFLVWSMYHTVFLSYNVSIGILHKCDVIFFFFKIVHPKQW